MTSPLLSAENLSVAYGNGAQATWAVKDVDLAIRPGEIIGIAGESGSGKSTLCAALIRALPRAARRSGRVDFDGHDLYGQSAAQLRELRRHHLGMVLQNPMTSLDPLYTIGDQVIELLRERDPSATSTGLRAAAMDLLRRVHLTAPELRLQQYPHELSGGMKQRVLIGMATASAPKILMADEPTSALDATIQEEILVLLREVRDRCGAAVVLVSHDLGAIRRVCGRTIVMYAGRIVEDGPTEAVFNAPRHPYTRGLIASLPQLVNDEIVLSSIPGQVPNLASLGPGCAFAARCFAAMPRCVEMQPPECRVTPDHRKFCLLDEVAE